MNKAELRAFFRDLRERMDNVSPDPDAQRFDYQTIAINALTAIKQVIDTGLEEDADQLHNAYHNGYEQGRFDEYADQIGREKAEKVKARIDKQKNCPYCHGSKRIRDALIYQHSRQILMLESNSLTYTLVLPKGRIYEVQQYIRYCPMCGRPLNKEEE